MRAEVSELPDGRWEAEDFLDNDGITDTALPIRVALEIDGDRLTLDFTGTARWPGRSTSPGPPPSPPATSRSSTSSRTCPPMPA
jgi:N-methylhydantoinase B/oxoprolinase/acetone carboxylase alpha subunit